MATTTLPIDQRLSYLRARGSAQVQPRSGDRSPARTGAAPPAPPPGATDRPDAEEVADSLMNGVSGFGLAAMTYLGLIPGFIPMVALTALVVAITLVPLLVVGLLAVPPLVAVRLVRRRRSG